MKTPQITYALGPAGPGSALGVSRPRGRDCASPWHLCLRSFSPLRPAMLCREWPCRLSPRILSQLPCGRIQPRKGLMGDEWAGRREKPSLSPAFGSIDSLCSAPLPPDKQAYIGCSFFQGNSWPWVWIPPFPVFPKSLQVITASCCWQPQGCLPMPYLPSQLFLHRAC